ncbi:MAG: hypothetical protein Q7K34_00905 [archaeon]|nr:hypothetical protein [archaeon]
MKKFLFLMVGLSVLSSIAYAPFVDQVEGAKGLYEKIWEFEQPFGGVAPEQPGFTTEFVDLESTGQAGGLVYLTAEKVGDKLLENTRFIHDFGDQDVIRLAGLEAQRAETLANYRFTSYLDEAYQEGIRTGNFTRLDSVVQQLKNSGDNIIKDNAAKVEQVLTTARAAGGNLGQNVAAGLKDNGFLETADVTADNTFRKAAEGKLASLKTQMENSQEITRLRQGYDVTIGETNGLKLQSKTTGRVFEVPSVGVQNLAPSEISKLNNVDNFVASTKAPLDRSSLAFDSRGAVVAPRVETIDSLVRKYGSQDITPAGKQKIAGKIKDAIASAEKAGVKGLKFENGLLSHQGQIIDLGAGETLLQKIAPGIDQPAGVYQRTASVIKNNAAKLAGTKGGQVAGKVLKPVGMVAKVGGKVLGVANVVVGAPALGARVGLALDCADYENVPPLVGLYTENDSLVQEINPNIENNIEKVKGCLKDAFERTEDRGWLVRQTINVANFFDPTALAQDIWFWADSPTVAVDYCSWAVYSLQNEEPSPEQEAEVQAMGWGCIEGKQEMSLSHLSKGDYTAYILVEYAPDFLEFINEEYSNGKFQLFFDSKNQYERIGFNCNGPDIIPGLNSDLKCFANEGHFGFAIIDASEFGETKSEGNVLLPREVLETKLGEKLSVFDLEKFNDYVLGVYVFDPQFEDNLRANLVEEFKHAPGHLYNSKSRSLTIRTVNPGKSYLVYLKKDSFEGVILVTNIKSGDLK